MKNHNNSNAKSKGKHSILQYIRNQVEKGTGLKLKQLKQKYVEEKLFYVALKHVTTTKKALCTALDIPIEAGCRYKRDLEKRGLLVQSLDEVVCPYTGHLAHLISTNSNEFERLAKSNTNQLKFDFDD